MNKKYTIEQDFCQLLQDNNSNLYFLLENKKKELGLPNKSIFFEYLNTSSVIFLIENYSINKEEFYQIENYLNKENIQNYLQTFHIEENEVLDRLINNKTILDDTVLSFSSLLKNQSILTKKSNNHHIFFNVLKNSIDKISATEMQQFNFNFLNKFCKIFEYCEDKFTDPSFISFYKQFLLKKIKIYPNDLFYCKFYKEDIPLLKKILKNLSFISSVEMLLIKTNILSIITKMELFDFTYSQYLDIFTDEELTLYKNKIQQLIIKNCYKKHYKVYSTLIFLNTNYLDRYYLIIDKKFYIKYINYIKKKNFSKFFEKNENLSTDDILKQQHLIKLYLDHFFTNVDFYLNNSHLVSFDIFEELSNYNKIFFANKEDYSNYIHLFFNTSLSKILNHNIFLSFLFCDLSYFFTSNEFYNFKLNKDIYSVNYLIFLLKNYWLLIQKFEVNDDNSSTNYIESLLLEFITDITNDTSNINYQESLKYIDIYLSSKQHSSFLYYLGNIFQEKYYKFLDKLKKIIILKNTSKSKSITLSHQKDNLLSLSFNFSSVEFINLKIQLIPQYLNYYLKEPIYNSYFLKYLLKKSSNLKYKKLFILYFKLHIQNIINTDIWLEIIHSPYFKNKELSINNVNDSIINKKIKNLCQLYLQHINNYNQLFINFQLNPIQYNNIHPSFFNELKTFIMHRNVFNFNNNQYEKYFHKYSNIENIINLSPHQKKSYLVHLKEIFLHIDYLIQKKIKSISYESLKKIIKKDLYDLDFSFISFFVLFDLFYLFEELILDFINNLSYKQINQLLEDPYFIIYLHNINLFKNQHPSFNFQEKDTIILDKLISKLDLYQLTDKDSSYIVYILNMFNNKNDIQHYILNSQFSKFILETGQLHFMGKSSKIFTQPYSKEEVLFLFEKNQLENHYYDTFKVNIFLNHNFEYINEKQEFINLIQFYIDKCSMVSLFLIKIFIKKFSINFTKNLNEFHSIINMDKIYTIYEKFYEKTFNNMHFHGISYAYQLSINFFKEFNNIPLADNIIDRFLILFFKKDILLLGLFIKFFHIENPLLYINQKYEYLLQEQSSDYLNLFYNKQNIKFNQSFSFFHKQYLEFIIYLLSHTLTSKLNIHFYHWLNYQLILYYKKQKYFTKNIEIEDFNEFKHKFLNILLNNPIIIDSMEKTKFTLILEQKLNQLTITSNSNNVKKIKKI